LFGEVPNARAVPERALERARADLQRWQTEGIDVITVLDPAYPVNLRAAPDRPPLIFVAGRLQPGDERSVAVIGSRRPSAAGLESTGVISACLGALDYTVFSGLATGIDTAAHCAALARDARTVAVIGTGLQRTYPRQNAQLQAEIARKGAVVSQFWPDAAPTRQSFPLRNAVMSGLTRASVIVEASHTSGARVQARAALAQRRPVALLKGLLVQAWAQELATRPGVHVVQTRLEMMRFLERLAPITG